MIKYYYNYYGNGWMGSPLLKRVNRWYYWYDTKDLEWCRYSDNHVAKQHINSCIEVNEISVFNYLITGTMDKSL